LRAYHDCSIIPKLFNDLRYCFDFEWQCRLKRGQEALRSSFVDQASAHPNQIGFTPSGPLGRRPPLALGAVAVAARVVGDARESAVLASLDVAAERRRTARYNRVHDVKLTGAHMAGIGFTPCLTVAAEDVRHLQT
jgi:hypothetical protein